MCKVDHKILDMIRLAQDGALVYKKPDEQEEEPKDKEVASADTSEEASAVSAPALCGWVELRDKKGTLMQRIHYQNGQKNGDFEIYDNGEIVVQKGRYKDDQLEGPLEMYERDALVARIQYLGGKKNGAAQFYKGQYALVEHQYQDDVLQGPTVSYYPNTNRVSMRAFYQKGVLDGVMTTYTDAGDVARTVTYTNGKRHGKCVLYYPTGEVFETSEYAEDVPCHVTTQFYQNGVKKYERYHDLEGGAVREVLYDLSGQVVSDTKKDAPA